MGCVLKKIAPHAITTINTMTTIKLPTVIVTDAVIPNEKNLLRKLSSAIRNIELKYKYIYRPSYSKWKEAAMFSSVRRKILSVKI
jgi:hypothetical protein